MDKKSISECDADADKAISTMVKVVIATAAVPAHVNWALTATAMGAGAVAIGNAYGIKLFKEEGWKLCKQFFLSAGFWFLSMNVGSKVFSMIAESTGIGYGVGFAIDAAISAAAAWAIGACAKEYFRREYLGQNKPTKEELGKIFRDTFKKKKNNN